MMALSAWCPKKKKVKLELIFIKSTDHVDKIFHLGTKANHALNGNVEFIK